jgi:hypothetical protein
MTYRCMTFFGAICFGWASYKFKQIKYGAMEAHEAPRDLNLPLSHLNDAMMGLVGYMCGHLVACDYIYKHR